MKHYFTKSELNALIIWTSSRQNTKRKAQVLKEILTLQDMDKDASGEYVCVQLEKKKLGKKPELVQRKYTFIKKGNTLTLLCPNGNCIKKQKVSEV